MQKAMPFGMPVKSMEYYPNQLELRLYWYNAKTNKITRRTYANVPVQVATKLFYMTGAAESQSYITKNIKGEYKVTEVKQM